MPQLLDLFDGGSELVCAAFLKGKPRFEEFVVLLQDLSSRCLECGLGPPQLQGQHLWFIVGTNKLWKQPNELFS